MSKKLLVMGLAIDSRTRKRGSGMKIEAWDPERPEEGAFGSTFANERGAFRFAFESQWLTDHFGSRPMVIRWRAYQGDVLFADTSMECNFQGGEMDFNIDIDFDKPYVAPAPAPVAAPEPPPPIAPPAPPPPPQIIVQAAPEVKLPPPPLVLQPLLPRILRDTTHPAWQTDRVVGQLVDEATDRPLGGYTLRCLTDEGIEIAFDLTSAEGLFILVVGERDRERLDVLRAGRLNFRIYSPDGHEAGTTTGLWPEGGRILPLKIPGGGGGRSPTIVDVGRIANINLPHGLLRVFTENGIHTLHDVRRLGGMANLGRLPIGHDHPALRAIEAHAALSTLSSDLELNGLLVDKGYTSALQIANTPQRDFVAAIAEQVGDVRAAQVHAAAQCQVAVVDQLLTGVQAQTALGVAPTLTNATLSPELTAGFGGSALGETAYLADLLAAAVRHLRRENGAVSVTDLVELIGQPLDQLMARGDGDVARLEPLEMRLAVETLRRYLGATTTPDAYLQAAYNEMLGRLGTSADELRLASHSPDLGRELGARLGLGSGDNEQKLAALWLRADLPDNHTSLLDEDLLERRFGLRSTKNRPLSGGAVFGDAQDQVRRWHLEGAAWSRNTDEDGIVYLRLKRSSGAGVRVTLFRDRSRTQPVAYGESTGTSATIYLAEQNGSGLRGWIEAQFSAEADIIELQLVPQVAAWRANALLQQWNEESGHVEPESAAATLVVDPDVIGPDDIRFPYPNNPIYELWRKRRMWEDKLLGELQQLGSASAMTDSMYKQGAVAYGATFPQAGWQDATPVAAFADLVEGLAHPARNERARARIAHDLGLEPAAFLRLQTLIAHERDHKLSPPQLGEVASILVQSHKQNLAAAWRDEEHAQRVTLTPENFYHSLSEPEVGAWPATVNAVLVDPQRPSDRRPDGIYGRRARYLFSSRSAELKKRGQALHDAFKKQGFPGLLRELLDAAAAEKLAELAALPKTPESAPKITETLASVGLTNAEWQTLSTPTTDGKTWADTLPALIEIDRRMHLEAKWHEEESNLGLDYWHAYKAALPRWRASRERRAEWQAALHKRNVASTIDPEVIGRDELSSPFAGAAFDLLAERRTWLDEKRREFERTRFQSQSGLAAFDTLVLGNLAALGKLTLADGVKADLRNVRLQLGIERALELGLGLSTTDLDALKAQLVSPSTRGAAERRIIGELCLSVEQYERMLVLRGYAQSGSASAAAGEEIDGLLANSLVVRSIVAVEHDLGVGALVERRLAQLGIDGAALADLSRMRTVAKHGPLGEHELSTLTEVLLAAERRRIGWRWRDEERERGVTLTPINFTISTGEPLVVRGPLASLRHHFVATIERRTAELASLTANLAVEAREVEEQQLPLLRDGIVMSSTIPGASLHARFAWMKRNVRVDCAPSPSARTSRIEYATRALQSLVGGALAGELNREPLSLTVSGTELPSVWPWLKTLLTWREAREQALFPEQHFTWFGRSGSHGWQQLRDEVEHAADGNAVLGALSKFSQGLHEIGGIIVEAIGHGLTTAGPIAGPRSLAILIGRSRETGRLFYATVDNDLPVRDALSEWSPLPGFEHHEHLRVLGMERHHNGLSLVAVSLGTFWVARFDLSRLTWQAVHHVWPAAELTSSVLVEDSADLRVTGRRDDGAIVSFALHRDHVGPEQVLVPALLGRHYSHVRGHISLGERGSLLLLATSAGIIHYRFLGASDDGQLRALAAGDYVGAAVLGKGVEVWWRHHDAVFRRRITPGARGTRTLEGFSAVSEWLLDTTGVDVKSTLAERGTYGGGRPITTLLTSELVNDEQRREVLANLSVAALVEKDHGLGQADAACQALAGRGLGSLLQQALDGASIELPWRDDAIELQPPLADLNGGVGAAAPSGTTRRLAASAPGDDAGWVVLERGGRSLLVRRIVEGERENLGAPIPLVPVLAPSVEMPGRATPAEAKAPRAWDLGRFVADGNAERFAPLATAVLAANRGAPRAVARYVEEAWLSAPLAAAEALHGLGWEREALAAEALAATEPLDGLLDSWPRIGDWADRPSDRTELVIGRPTALRRVLRMQVVERLVDAAREAEGDEQHALYQRAHDVLVAAFPGRTSQGERFLALETQIPAPWRPVWTSLAAELGALRSKEAIDAIFDEVKTTLASDAAIEAKLRKIAEITERARGLQATNQRLRVLVESQTDALAAAHDALLNEPAASEAASRAAERTSDRFLRDVLASAGIGRDKLRELIDEMDWLRGKSSTNRVAVASHGALLYVDGAKALNVMPAVAEISAAQTPIRPLVPAPLIGFVVEEPLAWQALRAEIELALLAKRHGAMGDVPHYHLRSSFAYDVSGVAAASHALRVREREPALCSEARELALHVALAEDELAAARASSSSDGGRRGWADAASALDAALVGAANEWRRHQAAMQTLDAVARFGALSQRTGGDDDDNDVLIDLTHGAKSNHDDHRDGKHHVKLSLAAIAPAELERFRQTGHLRFVASAAHGAVGRIRDLQIGLEVAAPLGAFAAELSAVGAATLHDHSHRHVEWCGSVRQSLAVDGYGVGFVALEGDLDAFHHRPVDSAYRLVLDGGTPSVIRDVFVTFELSGTRPRISPRPPSAGTERLVSLRRELPEAFERLTQSGETARVEMSNESLGIEGRARLRRAAIRLVGTGGRPFMLQQLTAHFTPADMALILGGELHPSDGHVSTQHGALSSLIGVTPVGHWDLSLPSTKDVRERLLAGELEDVQLLLSY